MGIEAAIIGASVIGVGGALFGSSQAAKAAGQARSAAKRAGNESIAFQKEMFEKALELTEPERAAGRRSTLALEEIARSPETSALFKLQKGEVLDIINKRFAATGRQLSGARAELEAESIGSLAADEATRKESILRFLSGSGTQLAGALAGGAVSVGRAGGATITGAAAGAGAATAAGAGLGTNISNQLIGGIGTALEFRQQQQLFDSISGSGVGLSDISSPNLSPAQQAGGFF